MIKVRYWLLSFSLIVSLTGISAFGQDSTPYSATPSYKAMLKELSRQDPRPSRISGAGELLQRQSPTFPIDTKENSAGLQMETSLFRLEVDTNPFRLTFRNKKTGALWSFDGVVGETSGIQWVKGKSQGEAGEVSLTKITSIRKVDGHWLLECTVSGGSPPVTVEVRAIAPGILRITADGSALGNQAQTGFHLRGEGPFFGLGE